MNATASDSPSNTFKTWLTLFRPGDWLLLVLCTLAAIALFPLFWLGGPADKAVVRANGTIVAELPLKHDRRFEVGGPLGTTVIVVDHRRVRVVSDPGPRQLCVMQGWLSRAGETAICAPNQVSVRIAGQPAGKPVDSIAY